MGYKYINIKYKVFPFLFTEDNTTCPKCIITGYRDSQHKGHPSQGAPPTPRSIRVRTARFG